jgi:hypothetical protein
MSTFEEDEHKDLPKLLAEGAIVNIKSKLVRSMIGKLSVREEKKAEWTRKLPKNFSK